MPTITVQAAVTLAINRAPIATRFDLLMDDAKGSRRMEWIGRRSMLPIGVANGKRASSMMASRGNRRRSNNRSNRITNNQALQ